VFTTVSEKLAASIFRVKMATGRPKQMLVSANVHSIISQKTVTLIKVVQQISINPTRTRPDTCRIVENSGLSAGTESDLSSYMIVCYYSYTCAAQLITGVFRLDIPIIDWFRVSWFSYVFSRVFIAEKVDE
jgi:hypothetical protein